MTTMRIASTRDEGPDDHGGHEGSDDHGGDDD